jgi:Protein of unknown function (DUF1549)/Protein of unknown function (DUF1553)
MRKVVVATLVVVGTFAELRGEDASAVAAKLDAQFASAWKDAGITPAAKVDDARYLRRVYLDVCGTLPRPNKIREFLLDPSPDKRARAVEQLLKSPEYATRWGNYWNAILMGRTIESAAIDQAGFKMWLHEEFAKNESWDKIVTTLITAEGWNTNRKPAKSTSDPKDQQERYAPATNWFLKHWQAMPELSSATSKIFLGVQLQCAQCHDHKTEKWTQEDYRQFTAFFVKTWPKYFDKGGQLGTTRIDTTEHMFVPPINKSNEQYLASYKEYVGSKPKLPGGHEVGTFGSRRKELAKWITAKDNPYFAKAIVNRMWGLLLGHGFVEPIDDFRPSNPPTLPAALDTLAADLTAHDFDLHHLIRVICASRPYQLACQAEEKSVAARHQLWSRYPMKQLEVEVLLEATLQGTGSTEYLAQMSKNNLELIRTAFARLFVTQISSDDSSEITNFDETIPRALLMLNGPLFCGTSRMTQGLALHGLYSSEKEDKDRIEQLYLLTLSRLSTAAETEHWQKFLAVENAVVSTPGPSSGDMKLTGLSALIPSKEITAAPADTEFSELIKHAKSAADFKAVYARMRNNADAGLYVRAFREFSAEAPFRVLAQQGGGRTAKEQAYEDLHWALLNCSEFLTNH